MFNLNRYATAKSEEYKMSKGVSVSLAKEYDYLPCLKPRYERNKLLK